LNRIINQSQVSFDMSLIFEGILTSSTQSVWITYEARRTSTPMSVYLCHTDSISTASVASTNFDTSSIFTELVIFTIWISLALRYHCGWSLAYSVHHQDHIGRTFAYHSSQRYVVHDSAFLLSDAWAGDSTWVLTHSINTGMLRGAVAISATFGLNLCRWEYCNRSCGRKNIIRTSH